MKTLLVTGGAGFIGGNFVLDLRAQGAYRVVNLDALTYAGNRDTLRSLDGDRDHVLRGDCGLEFGNRTFKRVQVWQAAQMCSIEFTNDDRVVKLQ